MAMSRGNLVLGQEHLNAGPAGHLLVGRAEAVVLRLADPSRPVDDHQRNDALGVCSGQPEGGHGPAGRSQDDGAVASGCVHDGQRVASPPLNRGIRVRRQGIGQPEPAGIEPDQA
jgi:hypothetical protein